jgi:hypothetical protein
MPLSVVDLYKIVLPKTNCRECGYPTCLAFASMVVSEKLPLKNCPHVDPKKLAGFQEELDKQHQAGKWTKKDMAADALAWAKERSASMNLADLPERIGGKLIQYNGAGALELPYFAQTILITPEKIMGADGAELGRWEQVFIYNHLAQGGSSLPGRNWLGLEQIPNTVSKIKSMRDHVEAPLIAHFTGKSEALRQAGLQLGGVEAAGADPSSDVAILFQPMPRVPILLVFWDAHQEDGFGARVKLLFDKTITEHLDIESILFLSERLRQLLGA